MAEQIEQSRLRQLLGQCPNAGAITILLQDLIAKVEQLESDSDDFDDRIGDLEVTSDNLQNGIDNVQGDLNSTQNDLENLRSEFDEL
jgi:peptidoglycan hydrolase CwlO-like protein